MNLPRFAIAAFVLLCGSTFGCFAKDPDALGWQHKGDEFYNAQDYDRAIAAYRKSLELWQQMGQEGAGVRHQLGFAHLGKGEKEQALPYFAANLDYHIDRDQRLAAPNFLYVAQIYLDLGRPAEAAHTLDGYPAYADDDAKRRGEVAHLHAIAHERAGDPAAARRAVRDARDFLPPELWRKYLQEDAVRLGVALTEDNVGVWLLAAGLLVALLLVWRNTPLRRYSAEATLFLVSVALTLVLAELALRAVQPPSSVRHFLHSPDHATYFRPADGVMPGVDYERSAFSINDVGLRGDPLPGSGVTRILAIGGSSTEALFVDDADAWPHVLQQQLSTTLDRQVWVGNAGKSGFNSFDNLVEVYILGQELAPDLVLVQAGINDLNSCISGNRPALFDQAANTKWPDYYDSHKRYVFDEIYPPRKLAELRLAQLFHRFTGVIAGSPQEHPVTEQRSFVTQDEAGLFYVEQRRRRAVAEREDKHPDISACLDVFEANLSRMVAISRDVGFDLALLTQGTLYRPDLPAEDEALLWFGSVDIGFFAPTPPRRYYTVAVMAELMRAYNQRILQVCTREGITCVDVDGFLPKSRATYYDDVHMNRQGSRVLGMRLAELLSKPSWRDRL